MTNSPLRGGDKITKSNGASMTLGICGTCNGQRAFLTCGYGNDFYPTLYVRGLYKNTMQNSSGTTAIAPGDSGGPVFVKSGSNYLLHGIVSATTSGTNYMYSTPVYYAIDVGFHVQGT